MYNTINTWPVHILTTFYVLYVSGFRQQLCYIGFALSTLITSAFCAMKQIIQLCKPSINLP